VELEERKKNNGLSAAYDSVFRSGDDPDATRRTKLTKRGTVRTMSKREAAEEDRLMATLR